MSFALGVGARSSWRQRSAFGSTNHVILCCLKVWWRALATLPQAEPSNSARYRSPRPPLGPRNVEHFVRTRMDYSCHISIKLQRRYAPVRSLFPSISLAIA